MVVEPYSRLNPLVVHALQTDVVFRVPRVVCETSDTEPELLAAACKVPRGRFWLWKGSCTVL